jgi:FHA domain
MDGPYIRVEESGLMMPLREDVTTIGRGRSVDVHLADPSVSRLHAEIVRRGPYAYVTDLGLSRNGTRVNGRLVARRVLEEGDVLTFGSARCRVFGIAAEEFTAEVELRRPAAPELTRRELDVVTSLCRPALSDEAFVAPATAREIAADLVVTEAAVKQHLLRLYQKFRIPEGANRRVRLANEVVALGLVRPLPSAEKVLPSADRTQPPADRMQPPDERAQPPAERAQAPAERSGLAVRSDGAERTAKRGRTTERLRTGRPAAGPAAAAAAPQVPASSGPASAVPAQAAPPPSVPPQTAPAPSVPAQAASAPRVPA